MEGQMNIFDFLDEKPEEKSDAICTKRHECEAYPRACGGTIEPCRFGGTYKWSKKYRPLLNNTECKHDHTKMCDRYGYESEEVLSRDFKKDIPLVACAGCCFFCGQAPMHGGKCKWECRRDKHEY